MQTGAEAAGNHACNYRLLLHKYNILDKHVIFKLQPNSQLLQSRLTSADFSQEDGRARVVSAFGALAYTRNSIRKQSGFR